MKRTHKSLATLVLLSVSIIFYGIIVAKDVQRKSAKTLELNRIRNDAYEELEDATKQIRVDNMKPVSDFDPNHRKVDIVHGETRKKVKIQQENVEERDIPTHRVNPMFHSKDTKLNDLKFRRQRENGTRTNVIGHKYETSPGNATVPSFKDPKLLNCTSPAWMGEGLHIWNDTAPSQASRTLLAHYGSALTADEKRTLNDIIRAFVHIAETNNLTYFLYLGTLLGVYRHQGMIPWDDDFDVVMLAEETPKISRVFSEQLPPPYRLYNESGRWKVYSNATAKTANHKYATAWNFLYIDIFFVGEDGRYFVGTKADRYFVFRYEKSHVLPVVRRPFWDMWLPLPRNYVTIINDTYPGERCISAYFSHREEHHIQRLSVKCSKLAKYYPFTTRTTVNLDNVMHVNETLMLNNTIIQWVLYKQV